MQDCPVCGRSFDPVGFQVVIPELRRGFDRIECARSARALATAGSAIAAGPLAALAPPAAATAARPAAALRVLSALGAPAAALGVLAAGAAAAAFLWWGVLGTDSDRFPLVRAGAPPAAAGETVEARVVPGAAPEAGPSNPRADVPRRILVALPSPGDAAPSVSGRAGEPSEPTRHSSRDGGAQTRQGAGGKHDDTSRDEGKGHPGLGNGHVKHGDTRDNHSPGHGHGKGNGQGKSNGHGEGNGQGQAKGKEKDKGHGHGKGKKH